MREFKGILILLGLILAICIGYYLIKGSFLGFSFSDSNRELKELRELRIDISKADTEIEKTAIIKFNNAISKTEKFYTEILSGNTEIAEDFDSRYEVIRTMNDFISYVDKNETNIKESLIRDLGKRLEQYAESVNSITDQVKNEEIENSDENKKTKSDSNTPEEPLKETIRFTPPDLSKHEEENISIPNDFDDQYYNREYNDIFKNRNSPCNKGTEPLIDFADKFNNDKAFRESRLRLSSGDKVDVEKMSIKIIEPGHYKDNESFIAYWVNIEENSAMFADGWLESELCFGYHFERINGKWYLIEYKDYSNLEEDY